jgi:hypothetical protein
MTATPQPYVLARKASDGIPTSSVAVGKGRRTLIHIGLFLGQGDPAFHDLWLTLFDTTEGYGPFTSEAVAATRDRVDYLQF